MSFDEPQNRQNLVSLVLLDLLPELGVLLDTDLLGLFVDELVQAAQIHVLCQQRDDVFVKGLPVRVFEVVFLALLLQIVLDKKKSEKRELCLQ